MFQVFTCTVLTLNTVVGTSLYPRSVNLGMTSSLRPTVSSAAAALLGMGGRLLGGSATGLPGGPDL